MSSGSKTTTQSTDLPDWMKSYGTDYLKRASDISAKPYTPYGGQTVAGMDPTRQQGIDMQAQMGREGTATGNAGSNLLTDTLSGKYMGGNPYLTQQIDQAQGDVIRNYNNIAKPQTESAMVRSGSFGNSGLMQMQQMQGQDLTNTLGRISSDMRSNAYNTERGAQQQALGLAPSYNAMQFNNASAVQDAGKQQQGQQQMQLDDAYRRFMEAQGYDAQQLGVLGNALGTLKPGVGTSSSTQPGASGMQNAASAALIASALFSDRRLKTDIKRIGTTDDGLGVYTYRYVWGGPVQMGVMAQEVEQIKPEAVINVNGVRMVDYAQLGA